MQEISGAGIYFCKLEPRIPIQRYLPEFLLEYEKELENQLFDEPFAHFRDCLSPLMKMKDGEWDSEYAIKYLTELRENGYVDNQEYNLW